MVVFTNVITEITVSMVVFTNVLTEITLSVVVFTNVLTEITLSMVVFTNVLTYVFWTVQNKTVNDTRSWVLFPVKSPSLYTFVH